MVDLLMGLIAPLTRLADKIWAKRVKVIQHTEAEDLVSGAAGRWSALDKVSRWEREGYKEFVCHNWYGRPTVYRDRSGGVLMIKKDRPQ